MLILQYIRMSGAQLLMICIFLMTPMVGDGPLFEPYMEENLTNCRKRWWLNLLFVNNFILSTDTCLYHSWLFALLMQLTLVAAVLVWILKKSAKVGILVMILLILSGMIGVGVMTVIHNLPGSLAYFMLNLRTLTILWRDVYQLPYDHIGPFCIGLLVGYFIAIKKGKLNISKLTSAGLWLATIACNTSVMFGLYRYRNGAPIDLSLATLYAVAHRNVWALGIGWLVVACVTHHGGAVSRVLKAKIFIPLDRLCYMAYVMHLPFMFFHSAIMRERFFMGHVDLLFLALGYCIIAFIISFFLNITFIRPYFAIEDRVSSHFCSKDKLNVEYGEEMKKNISHCSVIPVHEDFTSNGHRAHPKTFDTV